MEWVERTPSDFWPAKRRREHRRGKRADREALFRYLLHSHLDALYGAAMKPFNWDDAGFEPKVLGPTDDDVAFIMGEPGWYRIVDRTD